MANAWRAACGVGLWALMAPAAWADPVQTFKIPQCVKPGEQFVIEQKATSDGSRLNAHLRLCFPPTVFPGCHDETMTASPGAPTGASCKVVGGCQYKQNGAFDGKGPQCDANGAWPKDTSETLKVTCQAPPVVNPVDPVIHFGGQAFDISSGFGTTFKAVGLDPNCENVSITKKIRLWTPDGPGPPVDSATVPRGSFVCYEIEAVQKGSSEIEDALPADFVPLAVTGRACTVDKQGGWLVQCNFIAGRETVRICGYFTSTHSASKPAQNSATLLDDHLQRVATSNVTSAIVKNPAIVPTKPQVELQGQCLIGFACLLEATLGPSQAGQVAATTPPAIAWLSSDSRLVPLANGSQLRRSFPTAGKYKLTALATRDGFTSYTDFSLDVKPGAAACTANANTLCLGKNGRFRVQVDWQDLPSKTSDVARAHPLTSDTGAFWFFSPDNLELLVKVLDGTGLNGKFWVFYGALSNVQYEIKVTDTKTGAVKVYANPQGTQASGSDTGAFAAVQADVDEPAEPASEAEPANPPAALSEPALSCNTAGSTLCLDGRFRVKVDWTDAPSHTSGAGTPSQLTAQSGDFWFFNSSNLELLVKMVDGRGLNGKFWFFYGALSNVGYTITVTDTVSGAVKTYINTQGTQASGADTSAF